ncbi:MAG: hypothetical protein CMP10_05765 [Zetaproteobacteria bacterium]|nr:hypothetical protein [Pseudobdellovibrionaceae bacterium]
MLEHVNISNYAEDYKCRLLSLIDSILVLFIHVALTFLFVSFLILVLLLLKMFSVIFFLGYDNDQLAFEYCDFNCLSDLNIYQLIYGTRSLILACLLSSGYRLIQAEGDRGLRCELLF